MHKKTLEAQDTLNGGGKDTTSQSHSSDEEKSSRNPSTSMESLNVISPNQSPPSATKGYTVGFATNTEAFR